MTSASLLWFFGLQLIGLATYSVWARPAAHAALALALGFGAAMGLCVVWGGLWLALSGLALAALITLTVSAFFAFVVERKKTPVQVARPVLVASVLLAATQVLVGFGAAEEHLRAEYRIAYKGAGVEFGALALSLGAIGIVALALAFGLLGLLWRPTRSDELRAKLGNVRTRIREKIMPSRRAAMSRPSYRGKQKGGRRGAKR